MGQLPYYVLGPWDTNLNNSIMDLMMYMLIDNFLFPSSTFWCSALCIWDLPDSDAVCCCLSDGERTLAYFLQSGEGKVKRLYLAPESPFQLPYNLAKSLHGKEACLWDREEIRWNSLWHSLPWQLAHSFDKSLSQTLKSSRSPHDRWPLEEPTS